MKQGTLNSPYFSKGVKPLARLAKCKGCSKELKSDERFIHSNKTYCLNCYNLKIKESEDYDKLILWICKYFNQDKPNGLILKQIKDYKDKFEYTYAGIHYCLWYLTEIKNIKLQIQYGIALVKFEYEKAKDYFLQQQTIQKSVPSVKPTEIVRNIKMKSKKRLNSKLLINIDELISEKGDFNEISRID